MAARHITFCLCPGLPLFGLVSALDVLRHANRLGQRQCYSWSFLTEADAGVAGSNGMTLQPSSPLDAAADADMVFVVAGFAAWHLQTPRLVKWLARQARGGAVIGGLSNGAFILAEAGLLDRYAATVHWEDFSSFYESYPLVQSRYQRYVIDRNRMSSSGGAATLELFIEIVRQHHGDELVRGISRQMLLDDHASNVSYTQSAEHYSAHVRRILALLDAGIGQSMTVQGLARQVGLSRRELLRLLRRETGQTPSQMLNARRLERARSLVLHSPLALVAVADAVGFSSQSHMTLRYRQQFGVTPAQDRRRCRTGGADQRARGDAYEVPM